MTAAPRLSSAVVLAVLTGCTGPAAPPASDADEPAAPGAFDFDLWLGGERIGQGVAAYEPGEQTFLATWMPPGSDIAVEREQREQTANGVVVALDARDEARQTTRGAWDGGRWVARRSGVTVANVPLPSPPESSVAFARRCADARAARPCRGVVLDATTGTVRQAEAYPCDAAAMPPIEGARCVEVAGEVPTRWWLDGDGVPLVIAAPGAASWVRESLRARMPALLGDPDPSEIGGTAFPDIPFAPRAWVTVEGVEAPALDGGRQSEVQPGVVRIVREPRVGSLPLPFDGVAPSTTSSDAEFARVVAPLLARAATVRELAVAVVAHVAASMAPSRVALPTDPARALRDGVGDCTEMADVAAAMMRSAGVPARTVYGVAWLGERWVPHAWMEYADRAGAPGTEGTTWHTADPAWRAVPAPVDRVRLGVMNADTLPSFAGARVDASAAPPDDTAGTSGANATP